MRRKEFQLTVEVEGGNERFSYVNHTWNAALKTFMGVMRNLASVYSSDFWEVSKDVVGDCSNHTKGEWLWTNGKVNVKISIVRTK